MWQSGSSGNPSDSIQAQSLTNINKFITKFEVLKHVRTLFTNLVWSAMAVGMFPMQSTAQTKWHVCIAPSFQMFICVEVDEFMNRILQPK